MKVSLRDAFKIRRIYRRLARRKVTSSLRRITVFIRYENVIRLLEFLGFVMSSQGNPDKIPALANRISKKRVARATS